MKIVVKQTHPDATILDLFDFETVSANLRKVVRVKSLKLRYGHLRHKFVFLVIRGRAMKFIPKLSIPNWWLCVFFLATHVVGVYYAARGLEEPAAFELLSSIGLLWLISWWLEDDGKKYGLRW